MKGEGKKPARVVSACKRALGFDDDWRPEPTARTHRETASRGLFVWLLTACGLDRRTIERESGMGRTGIASVLSRMVDPASVSMRSAEPLAWLAHKVSEQLRRRGKPTATMAHDLEAIYECATGNERTLHELPIGHGYAVVVRPGRVDVIPHLGDQIAHGITVRVEPTNGEPGARVVSGPYLPPGRKDSTP